MGSECKHYIVGKCVLVQGKKDERIKKFVKGNSRENEERDKVT